MTDMWQLHRAGLINFWYYNEHQEFHFADGRLLFRGSNGSGKSVTMQSFIPLLLDGNRSSERLDPFGSRSRKLDNYLLEEGDDRSERTGYLYLEFIQPDTQLTQTIGMGMRARKDMPLDTWYFYLGYGLKIGDNFHLYRNQARTHVLTKGELKKLLGDQGEVFESQRAYMEAVNHYIFGFDSMEEYRELINLLIQLRSPKLSKDFKPTVISEILTQSLQPLSDEDLKPLSESVENMDEIETNLMNLEISSYALQQLSQVFVQYNSTIFQERQSDLLEVLTDYQEELIANEELAQAIEANQVARDQIHEKINEKESEAIVVAKQIDHLQEDDLIQLREKLDQLLEQLTQEEVYLKDKQRQIDKKADANRQLEGRQRDLQQTQEDLMYRLRHTIQDLDSLAEEGHFDEHAFMKGELSQQISSPYAFETHQRQVQQYQAKLAQAYQQLQHAQQAQEAYERIQAEYDQLNDQKTAYERDQQRWRAMSQEAKETWSIDLRQWKRNCETFKISAALENDLYQTVNQAHEVKDLEAANQQLQTAYHQLQLQLERERIQAETQIQQTKEVLATKQAEYQAWLDRKEAEPHRSEAVIANRQWLTNQGIPHKPFYHVLDFKGELEEAVANDLEELLLELGWLDALLVPGQYRDQVLANRLGQSDRYLFYEDHFSLADLADYLDLVWSELSDEADASLLFVDHLDETLDFDLAAGQFQQGRLIGTISHQHQAKYIGHERRHAFYEQECQRLAAEVKAIEIELTAKQQQITRLHEQFTQAEAEYRMIPDLDDVKTALEAMRQLRQELATLQGQLDRLNQQLTERHQAWQTALTTAQEHCRQLYLPASIDLLDQVAVTMRDYYGVLMELIDLHRQCVTVHQNLKHLEGQLEETREELSDMRGEETRYQRLVDQLYEERQSLEYQLAQSDYKSIKAQLEEVLKRHRALPGEILHCKEELARLEERLRYQLNQYEAAQAKYHQLAELADQMAHNFYEEIQLGYLFTDEGQAQLFFDQYHQHWQAVQQNQTTVASLTALIDFVHRAQTYLDATRYLPQKITLISASSKLHNLFVEMKSQLTHYVVQLAVRFKGEPCERNDLVAILQGQEVSLFDLQRYVAAQVETNQLLLQDKDRILFEEIITNTIGRKIRAKIYHSERWVKEMNDLMTQAESSTSNGFVLSLRWKHKQAQREGELSSKELIDLLKMDAALMTDHHRSRLTLHFRTKIQQAREEVTDQNLTYSFHAALKEILDYRQWFEFQIYFKKAGEKMTEMTNNKFFALSGGEKAMAMYIPLFSAVVAKYRGARSEAPRIISLDEAFAGIDDQNIREMFRFMVQFQFNYMINSQILWGDYDTVPAMRIYQLIRPNNAKFVTVIPYLWNGHERLAEGIAEEEAGSW